MGESTYAIAHFLGGELSQFSQGRFDRPDYRTSLNICFNAFPAEGGPWTRRPGSQYAGHTRGGAPGRVIKFDFEQSSAITIELTDGHARFRSGTSIIPTNDPNPVVAISTANPAVVQTTNAHGWSTGDVVFFFYVPPELLQNRQFLITVIDSTHFSLADALTGASIDGSTLDAVVGTVYAARVQDLATPYTAGSWASIRAVQAETTSILLCATVPPQALTVTTLPVPTVNAVLAIAPTTFNDGPYLDPFTNGVQAVPGSTNGIVSLTLSFPAYSATSAYAKGAFVTASSVNYISLLDQNVGNTPSGGAPWWAPTSASAAINNGRGFLGTDIGRLVRLLSEPPLWLIGTSYVNANVVAYNPGGEDDGTLYYQAVGSSTGIAPGSTLDGTNWSIIASGAALWTWGKIVTLANIIDRSLAGSASIGNMTSAGGLSAAFDGVFSKASPLCAGLGSSGGTAPFGTVLTETTFIGKNYSGASNQKIEQVTIYPASDVGFIGASAFGGTGVSILMTLNLRAKATAPGSSSDGTLLGTTGQISNQTSAITIVSSDQATAWAYVWVEQITTMQVTGVFALSSWSLANYTSQVSFFNPPGTGSTSAGIDVEILGPPLLYTNPILTWRLGAYSNTTGWPTCGCYDDGRLWLGGAIPNRFDASMSNGIQPGSSVVNFAPTDQYGVVAANAGISETINSDSSNPIRWMEPDLQGIVMGTQAGEFLVLAPTSGSIAPNNITSRRITRIGGAAIAPVRTEHTLAVVQRYMRKLAEFFADVYSGKFTAPNIADKADHIIRNGIAELAYVSAVTPIIWVRDALGVLSGITYKRDTLTTSTGPTFYGWHRHALGSGRIVESICSGPSVGGDLDALTMVTNDPATNIRHVEILTDAMDEITPLAEAWFLDDAVTPTSTAQVAPTTNFPYGGLTLNGLWHLNGKTVQVFAGGLDCGDYGPGTSRFTDFTVTNGSVFVPYGDSLSAGPGRGLFTAAFVANAPQIVVGFTYDSDGQLVRPISMADTGARNGPALGKIRRNHRYAALLSNTLGISFGCAFDSSMIPARFTLADRATNIPPLTSYSGVYEGSIEDNYGYDGMLCWRVSRPFPANVVAISGNLQTQDQ